jgi:hypothetical protein
MADHIKDRGELEQFPEPGQIPGVGLDLETDLYFLISLADVLRQACEAAEVRLADRFRATRESRWSLSCSLAA